MDNDLHIEILKCVRAHKTITISAIEKNLGLATGELKWINEECDTGSKVFIRQGKAENSEWLLSLSMTGWQILLDFESLSEARSSSIRANWIAVGALFVASLGLLFRGG